jgi:hypothetical protein
MSRFTNRLTTENSNRLKYYWVGLITTLISFFVYVLTSFRTITWWDNTEYSLAAFTLGVAHPPGSLLITLIGWIVAKIPLGMSAIFKLNLLAGLGASLTITIIIFIAIDYYRNLEVSKTIGSANHLPVTYIVGLTLGGLAFAFSATVWSYATKFSPYIFTALLTSAIIWSLLRWWAELPAEKTYRWLFVLMLLFGLDFSIHRTNMLLLPSVLIALVIGNWRVIKSIRSWVYGILGYLIGLSFQLLVIPIAARQPFLNSGDPSNLARFWNYISLKQYGGDWLINIFPRKASFWSYQIPDYFNTFSVNFLNTDSALGIWGIFPAIFGLFGFIMLWKSNRRLAIVTLIMFLFASIGAILYFNLPENYFRSNDRHYLPSFVIFAFWIVLGCGSIMKAIAILYREKKWAVIVSGLIMLWIMPLYQIAHNYHPMDCSRNYFADNFGRNLLETLPERAILFTNGDIDTYTPWYFQGVEKLRQDVTVVNLPLLNTPWFVSQLMLNDPEMPLSFTSEEISSLNIKPWDDTTLFIPTKCDRDAFNISDTISLPDSIGFRITPTIADRYLLIQDWVLFQIISRNAWRRPIYFAITLSNDNKRWVAPYLRPEGLAQRLMPYDSPPINPEILASNLIKKYAYRGYNDTSVIIDNFSKMIAFNYYPAFIELATAQAQMGDYPACENTRDFLLKILPINRLSPMPASFVTAIDSCCRGSLRQNLTR